MTESSSGGSEQSAVSLPPVPVRRVSKPPLPEPVSTGEPSGVSGNPVLREAGAMIGVGGMKALARMTALQRETRAALENQAALGVGTETVVLPTERVYALLGTECPVPIEPPVVEEPETPPVVDDGQDPLPDMPEAPSEDLSGSGDQTEEPTVDLDINLGGLLGGRD